MKTYRVQYLDKHTNVWKSIRGYSYDSLQEAEAKAEKCRVGFGETRVICVCTTSTKA